MTACVCPPVRRGCASLSPRRLAASLAPVRLLRRRRATPSRRRPATATRPGLPTRALPGGARGRRADRPGHRARASVTPRPSPTSRARTRWAPSTSRSPRLEKADVRAVRRLGAHQGDPDDRALLRAGHGHQRRRHRPRWPSPVPLYVVDGDNRLIEASTFTGTFKPCESAMFPKKFKNGDTVKACLVYLAPDKGDLTAVSFRPDQEFNPIIWTGELDEAGAGRGEAAGRRQVRRRRSNGDKKRRRRRQRAALRDRRIVARAGPAGTMGHDRPAHLADPRGAARRHPRGAGADGRHHQRGLPPAVCRAGRRALRLRDDHLPRPGRGRRDHPADAGLRRGRAGPLGPALRHRPAYVGKATEILCAEYGVAPRRPELRLPGAQGDPQGRRRSPAVEARPARRDPRARRSRPPRRTTCR